MIARSLLLIPFLVTIACSGTAEEVTLTPEEELSVGVGKICAGGVVAAQCAEGLKCSISGRIGRCVADPNAVVNGASEGETCGGTADIKCASGLTCKKKAGASAKAKGKCTAGAACLAMPTCDEGHSTVSDADDCADGDECYKRTRCGKTIWCTGPAAGSDESGTAGGANDEDGAGPGERCGSGFAGTIKCQPPLRCSTAVGLGTCR
jgi:hypothetical protein